MVKIRIVTSTSVTQAIVNDILFKSSPIIGVSCKTTGVTAAGPLVLIIVLTWDGNIFIFDVKKNGDMVIAGGLGRLLESTDLLKVFHDCRSDTAALHSQFRVNTRNVFDTQAAYSVVMEELGLPTRVISVHDLHEKYGGTKAVVPTDLELLMSQDANFWARRPLSRDVVHVAADSVTPLKHLHDRLNQDIKFMSPSGFNQVCSELIHEFCDPKLPCGRRSRQQVRTPRLSPRLNTYSPGEKPPIMSMTRVRTHILDKTVPLASPRAMTWN